jgi:hypothetical protein
MYVYNHYLLLLMLLLLLLVLLLLLQASSLPSSFKLLTSDSAIHRHAAEVSEVGCVL